MCDEIETKEKARTILHTTQHVLNRHPSGLNSASSKVLLARDMKAVLQQLNISLDEAIDLLRFLGKRQRGTDQGQARTPTAFELAWTLEECNAAVLPTV